jgi:hypothetical protein
MPLTKLSAMSELPEQPSENAETTEPNRSGFKGERDGIAAAMSSPGPGIADEDNVVRKLVVPKPPSDDEDGDGDDDRSGFKGERGLDLEAIDKAVD